MTVITLEPVERGIPAMVQLAGEPEALPDPPFDDDQVRELGPGPPATVPDKLMVEAVEVPAVHSW